MAAEEVIHFPFWAQLSKGFNSPALFLPEPVAEPPPQPDTRRLFVPGGGASSRFPIRVSN
jgi:hypothetical protein